MFSPLRSFKQEPEFLELRGFIKNDLLHEVLMREYLKSRLGKGLNKDRTVDRG